MEVQIQYELYVKTRLLKLLTFKEIRYLSDTWFVLYCADYLFIIKIMNEWFES